MDHILYEIFKTILNLSLKSMEKRLIILIRLIRRYVSKIKNKITFRIKTGYYLELLMPETMKLLKNTKNKISKDKKGENVPHLKFTEVVLVHCNIVNSNYKKDSRILYTSVPNESVGQLLHISPKNFVFLKTFDSEFSYTKVWLTDQN